MLTLGKKHAGFCQGQLQTHQRPTDISEWRIFFLQWLTILRIYQEAGMSPPFSTSKRKVFLVSKFTFPWSWKWLCSWYVENRAVLVQLEVIFSLELPHMKTQSNICLHFLGCDCYCLQISLRAWGGRHHAAVTHCDSDSRMLIWNVTLELLLLLLFPSPLQWNTQKSDAPLSFFPISHALSSTEVENNLKCFWNCIFQGIS